MQWTNVIHGLKICEDVQVAYLHRALRTLYPPSSEIFMMRTTRFFEIERIPNGLHNPSVDTGGTLQRFSQHCPEQMVWSGSGMLLMGGKVDPDLVISLTKWPQTSPNSCLL